MQRAHGSTERTNLIAARTHKGWTQKQVADMLGVDRMTVGRWEEGKNAPQSYYLPKLCSILEKTVEELGLTKEHEQTSVEEVSAAQEQQDTYAILRDSWLTLRLWHIVCTWPGTSARYHDLQMVLTLELEDNIIMNPENELNRREALYLLAGTPIEWCALSAFMPVFKRPVEEILTQCAAGISACWYLRKGKDLLFVSEAIDKYVPTLDAIARRSSVTQRQTAADLLAQCFLLKSELAKHVTSSMDAIGYAQQAEKYSLAADNPLLRIASLKKRASAHWYAHQWDQSRSSTEEANNLLSTVKNAPLILQSRIHSGLAPDLAFVKKKQDALTTLYQAHEEFSTQSKNEPLPIWIYSELSRGTMGSVNDGLTYFHLEMWNEAFDAFEQITKLPGVHESARIEALINQAMVEANRNDASRDMELCIKLWTEGIEGAKVLKSTELLHQAIAVYRAMRTAWPGEQKIVELRSHIIHW